MLPKRTFQLFILLEITMEWWLPTVRCDEPCAMAGNSQLTESRRRQKGGLRKEKGDSEELKFIEEMKKKHSSTLGEVDKFTIPTTTTPRKIRTLSTRLAVSFEEECDYLAYYCMKAYDTGLVCGRTLYYNYDTFKNYCMLDYVNCMERYEVWQVVHMGSCFNVTELTEYEHYEYKDDLFLDQMYVIGM